MYYTLIKCSDVHKIGNSLLMHTYIYTYSQIHPTATPPVVPINRDAVAQQMINRRGKVVDNYDEDTLVSSSFFNSAQH